MHEWQFGWVMMIVGGLLMVLFWGVVIGLAVWAIRAFTQSERNREGGRPAATYENTALEILKQRYARGEITRDEYQAMRHDLES